LRHQAAVPTPPAADARAPQTERGWPLRITLLIAVTVALLPIAIVSILQGIERARLDVVEVHDRLVQSANAAATEEQNLLASAEQITRALANLTDVRLMTPNCDGVLADALIGVKYFGSMTRIDRTGRVACSALPLAKGVDLSNRQIFRQARASSGFVVSGQMESAILHRPVIEGMLPLRDKPGNFDGAMGISLEMHWLDFMVRGRDLPKGAVVFVYDANGHILASNDAGVAKALIGSEKRYEGGTAPGELHSAYDGGGNSWTYASAPLRDSSISVAFAMREKRLFGPTYLHVGADFLMPILMIGLAWAGIWFATERQVTQWIVYLRRISAAYRTGHYTIRPQLEGAPREFRSLGNGLSAMADSIQDRDRSLRDALAQKSLLIREIHHRVKNNLQIVMSLLSLQAGQLKDVAAREALMQAQVRINALALVHRILHEIEDQTTIDLKRLLHELIQQITEGMRGENTLIRVQENLVDRDVSGDVAVPLALFTVEALTNIFKYAFPPGHGGVVSVSLQPVAGNKLRLVIADNGVGFDTAMPRTGIGTRLIKTFGTQIGGSATMCSTRGKGTTIEVVFDDPASRPVAAGS
jgi:two-component sensor histidine kinase